MAAGLADHKPREPKRAGGIDVDDLSPLRDAPTQRVVSVSPSDAARDRMMPRDRTDESSKVFLTPRVLDQRSFDELSGRLGALIDDAGKAAETLTSRLAEAQMTQTEPNQASAQLQERLRLGARMLKAFQTQIDRVEAVIGRLDERRRDAEDAEATLDEQWKAFQTHVDQSRRQAEADMDRAAKETQERLEAHVADFISRLPDPSDFQRRIDELVDSAKQRTEEHVSRSLEGVDEGARRLEELELRLEQLRRAQDGAEAERQTLQNMLAETTANVQAKSAEAKEIMRQSGEAKAMLAEALLDAAEQIDQLGGRSEGFVARIQGQLDRTESAEQRLREVLASAGAVNERVNGVEELCRRLELVLERLTPWEKLLVDSEQTEDGIPKPVAQTIEGLRHGIGRDMAAISAAMRDLAGRVDDLGLPGAESKERESGEKAETTEIVTAAAADATPSEAAPALRFRDHVEGG